ncbi:MAG: DUF4352 domain-containing protein [Mycobacterium sp.]
MNYPTTPAGWYPDPTGKGQRFWDGQAWAAAPAPPPPKKGKSGKIAAGIVAGFVGLIVIGNLGDDDTRPAVSSSAELSPAESSSVDASTVPAAAPVPAVPVVLPGVGEEVRDGKFAFVITGIDRSKIAGDLSNQFMQEEAQGEFINVRMAVTNIGDEAQTFFATNQKLMAAGREYEADSLVAMWTDSSSVEINPGNSIAAVASFDVPPGTVPETISLHDSFFSGGVDVQL